jgi:type II restriction/modification system DNA methylase subunit YeeA
MMKLKTIKPRLALNKAYQKQVLEKDELIKFTSSFKTLLDRCNPTESEEYNKNLLATFLNETFYRNTNQINTYGRIDLVIYSNMTTNRVDVMIEAKRPDNRTEMISPDDINKKSLHELMLYYFQERSKGNLGIKNLIITDVYNWYIIDGTEFDKKFFQNKELRKSYEQFSKDQFVKSTNDLFYKDIAEPFIRTSEEELEATYFNINDFKELLTKDVSELKELIPVYKLLSPAHLLKKPFANDSNTLNNQFYHELLYIVGLEEVKEAGVKIIQRCGEGRRKYGSLIENTIRKIESEGRIYDLENPEEYGNTEEEQVFSIALSLCLTWINRLLFMKLLESQLLNYHNNQDEYAFLNPKKIDEFDDLNTLFFQVFNRKETDRDRNINKKYDIIPYLNSSLFELSYLEHKEFTISGLEDKPQIQVYSNTVLKDGHGRRISGELNTLNYLLKFLDTYDFSSEGAEEIVETSKTLINASVLGLIFEKINGYKDGSFFTPGFVTMFMARKSLEMVVLQRFNEEYSWNCQSITELYNRMDISLIDEYNKVFNSIKICDIAVGSGHYLVSMLNEMIALKSELGLLCDKDGRKLKDWRITVENDELHIEDQEGKLFEYKVTKKENGGLFVSNILQTVQKTIFDQKRYIIENCLFGVDINPNSVKICRLRLWIELLKNAYYTEESGYKYMETLPNIDINIKTGDSLISRYPFQDNKNQTKAMKNRIEEYRGLVGEYKRSADRGLKKAIEKKIATIKNHFSEHFEANDPRILKKGKLAEELHNLNLSGMFDSEMSDQDKEKKEKKKLVTEEELNKITEELEQEVQRKLYHHAFEWRFEFPEVLDEFGNFIGFDMVIGNPPYIQLQKEAGRLSGLYENQNYKTFARTGDIYSLFYERAYQLLRDKGVTSYITSNKWMRAGYGKNTRQFLGTYTDPKILIDFGGLKVFDSATVDTNVLIYTKDDNKKQCLTLSFGNDYDPEKKVEDYLQKNGFYTSAFDGAGSWVISNPIEERIKKKIEEKGTPLKEWDINIYRGILTGYNKAFIIDGKKKEELIAEDPKSAEIIKPIIIGKDVKRFYNSNVDKWLILFPKGKTIKTLKEVKPGIVSEPVPRYGYVEYHNAWDYFQSNYPAIANHLIDYKEKAEKRQDQGDYWWELRACAYLDDFEKEKIVWKRIGSVLRFQYDDIGSLCLDSTCILTSNKNDIKYLCAVMNSKVSFDYLLRNSPKTGTGDVITSVQAIEPLPIPKISEEDQKPFIELVDKILEAKEANPNADTSEWEQQIDQLVYQLYDLTEEEIKVVEGEESSRSL